MTLPPPTSMELDSNLGAGRRTYGPTRVPCCQCAFSSEVRNAGVYCPYRIALYLHVGWYRMRAVRRTLCCVIQLHRLLRLQVTTSVGAAGHGVMSL